MRSKAMGAAVALLVTLTAAGCDEATGPNGSEQVAVAFRGGSSMVAAAPAGAALAPDVIIEGSNGTLVIEDLRVIVAEFELDRLNTDGCVEEADECEEFEAPPVFVDVPLDGGQVVAVSAVVDADTYDGMEFEIEDLEDDEEDAVEAQQIADLRSAILAEFPDWPRQASMLVTGTFTPTDGAPVPFRVYFEAEVEIELDLAPPVTVTDDGNGATFTVDLSPAVWFTRGDGTVMDLSAFDYDATGQLLEFEFEMEHGFTEIEFED